MLKMCRSREFKQFWMSELGLQSCLKCAGVENLSNSGRLSWGTILLKTCRSREFKQFWTSELGVQSCLKCVGAENLSNSGRQYRGRKVLRNCLKSMSAQTLSNLIGIGREDYLQWINSSIVRSLDNHISYFRKERKNGK